MEFIKNKRGLRLIITFILLIMVSRISIIDKMNWVGQVLFGCYIKYKEVITIASRDGYLSIIALDISALFIVTTLMAMLGEKKCIIYHKDIIYERLIRPTWGNFLDLTIYSFLSMFLCMVGFVLKKASMVVMMSASVFLFISLLVLKMITIYFDSNGLKKKIQREIFDAMKKDIVTYKKNINDLKDLLDKQISGGENSQIASNLELLALCAFEEDRREKSIYAGYWFRVSCRMLAKYHPTELVRFYIIVCKKKFKRDEYIKDICNCERDNQRKFCEAFSKCLNQNVLHDSFSGIPGESEYYEDLLKETESALGKYYNNMGNDRNSYNSCFGEEEAVFDDLPYINLIHYSCTCVDTLEKTLRMVIDVEKKYIKERMTTIHLTSKYVNSLFFLPKYIYNWDKKYYIYLARKIEEIIFYNLLITCDKSVNNYLMGSYIAGYYHYLIFDNDELEKRKSERDIIVRNHFFQLLEDYYLFGFGGSYLLNEICEMIKYFCSNDIVIYLKNWYNIIELDLKNEFLMCENGDLLCHESDKCDIVCTEVNQMGEWEKVKNASDLLPVCEKQKESSYNKDFVRDERLIELRNYMKDCFFEIYEMHKNKEDVVEAINRYIKAIL